jgi:hypothetical protein
MNAISYHVLTPEVADKIRDAHCIMDGRRDRPQTAEACWTLIEDLLAILTDLTGINHPATAGFFAQAPESGDGPASA